MVQFVHNVMTIHHITIVSIEDLKKRTGITDTQLDTEIVECNLQILACRFDHFGGYLDKLDLTRSARCDIRKVNLLEDNQSAMREALRMWITKNPFAATYRKLLEIVLSLEKFQVATDICYYISKYVPQPMQRY